MTTRTKITSCGRDECTISYTSWTGERVTRTFSARPGGYVTDQGDKQPCGGLADLGATLIWSGRRPLVDLIRREYRRGRAQLVES